MVESRVTKVQYESFRATTQVKSFFAGTRVESLTQVSPTLISASAVHLLFCFLLFLVPATSISAGFA